MVDTYPRQRGDRGAEAVTAIAQHVRALRQSRGWSLDELSGRSGVSKGMVVQIEGARTNPSVGTLSRLADAFGIAVGRLLEPAASRRVRLIPAAAPPMLWRSGYGGYARLLAGVTDPSLVELWEVQLQPQDSYAGAANPPGARALLHVLVGTVVVTAGEEEHPVGTGETLDFVADREYSCRNDGETVALAIGVVVLPGTPA
jgi:transcriptional regulator with XRE-family HTH domain